MTGKGISGNKADGVPEKVELSEGVRNAGLEDLDLFQRDSDPSLL